MNVSKQFAIKTLVLSTLTALYNFAQADYTQGNEEIAKISVGETVSKIDTVDTSKIADRSKPIIGEHDRLGNPVRIIWYGNANEKDGQVAQKGVNNQGIIQAGLIVNAHNVRVPSAAEKGASILIENQANGIDALSYTSSNNPNNAGFDLTNIDNQNTIISDANLVSGAGVHGNVHSFSTANGISITSTADFGRYAINGGIDGVSGATGISSSTSSTSGSSSLTSNNASLTEEMLIAADEGEETAPGTPADTSQSDRYGKDIQMNVETISNSGLIKAKLTEQGHLANKIVAGSQKTYIPQFYGATSSASGNGISLSSFIDTPDRYNSSDSKVNTISLKRLENTGYVSGTAEVLSGRYVTHTNTNAVATGNGVSLFAGTGRGAKNSTTTEIREGVINSGKIFGQLKQVSGNNSSAESVHLYSFANSLGSGNGLSLLTNFENYQTRLAKTYLGNIDNTGRISGEANLKAGDGNGMLNVKAIATGNGISIYQSAEKNTNNSSSLTTRNTNATTTTTVEIKDIKNKGIISGNLQTQAGIAAGNTADGQSIPQEELKVYIKNKQISSFSEPSHTPSRPTGARTNRLSFSRSQDSATTEVLASGNGISAKLAEGAHPNVMGAKLGAVDNRGVISGYAKLFYGYKSSGYDYIRFLQVGTGISNDREFDETITNSGIISGNIAALLTKGTIDDSSSFSNPTYRSGYKQTIENNGLMAGILIAGNYSAATRSGSAQYYSYFNADNDPVTNKGVQLLLQSGFNQTTRNPDYEKIDHIVNGSGGETTIDGINYQIINAPVMTGNKDSEYHLTDNNLNNKIVNGVGIENGALVVSSKEANLNQSIINGYRVAVKLLDEGSLTSQSTLFNANGFKANRDLDTFAIEGDATINTVKLNASNIINGNIDLKEGDDHLVITDNTTVMNGNKIDMNEGIDTVIIGGETVSSESAVSKLNPIRIDYDVLNAENLQINAPSHISSSAKISGVNQLSLNSQLLYSAESSEKHALHDSTRTGVLKLTGKGSLTIDSPEATKELSFGGLGIQSTEGNIPTLSTTNVLQAVKLQDGKLIISVKEAEEEPAPATPTPNVSQDNTNPESAQNITQPKNETLVLSASNNKEAFETPYTSAYTSLVDVWRSNKELNPVANSASTLNQTATQAAIAVNSYLAQVVNHNFYGALPQALSNHHQAYRQSDQDNHSLLKQNEFKMNASTILHQVHNKNLLDSSNLTGLLINFNYGINDGFTIGATLGGGSEKFTGHNGSELKGHSNYIGLHTIKVLNPHLQLEVGATYSKSSFKGKRQISNGYDAQSFDIKASPSIASVYSQIKYILPLGQNISFEPRVGLAYNSIRLGGISESGAGGLTLENSHYNTTEASIGQDIIFKYPTTSGQLSAKLSLDHVRTQGQKDVSANFSGSNTRFSLTTDKDKSSTVLGSALEYQARSGFSVKAGIANNFKQSGNHWHTQLGISYKF